MQQKINYGRFEVGKCIGVSSYGNKKQVNSISGTTYKSYGKKLNWIIVKIKRSTTGIDLVVFKPYGIKAS